jgi:ferritin-like metal-binding protein YciE
LPNSATQLLRTLIEDAIASEKAFEAQLRAFAESARDDDEVRALFAGHAEETRTQHERLRLLAPEDLAFSQEGGFVSLLHVAPQITQPGHPIEEQILQNLISSYTVETGELAMYEALAVAARAAGDTSIEDLARQLQNEERLAAENIWHLLPSRSKIAFNMLTVSEIDPAVETKVADDRLIGS